MGSGRDDDEIEHVVAQLVSQPEEVADVIVGHGCAELRCRSGPNLCLRRVRAPVESGIKKWPSRDITQEVCPWNVKFARALKVPEFAPRAAVASNDARRIADELLAMTQEEFSVAFKGSPMKRAKLRGLKRNAAVALGNVGAVPAVAE